MNERIEQSKGMNDTGKNMLENVMVISAFNITKTYEPGTKALDNVSVSIQKGKITVILGPSGSGKTTLLNILALLDKPDSGKITLEGKDISMLSEKEAAIIRNKMFGFVFQFFHLIPELTVEENIMVPLMIRNPYNSFNEHRERVYNLLADFHLENKKNQYPNKLSGGEKQKVSICRSLAGNPNIIFADEPTGNLDRESASELISIIEHLNRTKGKTFVIATHNENFLKIATNVVYLSGGKIINRE